MPKNAAPTARTGWFWNLIVGELVRGTEEGHTVRLCNKPNIVFPAENLQYLGDIPVLDDLLYCIYKMDDKPHQLFRSLEDFARKFADSSEYGEMFRLLNNAYRNSRGLARDPGVYQKI